MVCLVLSINCTDQSVCYQAKKSNFYAKYTRLHSLGRDPEIRYMPEGKALAARFLFEVLAAVSQAIGADRVGVRLSPLNSYNDMRDSDPVGLLSWLAGRLNDFGLAYLHLMRADFYGRQTGDVLAPARKHFQGPLIVNMGYSAEEAQAAVFSGQADAVAFGTAFLANPDLPARIRKGAALNSPDVTTFYTSGAQGYTDYPLLEDQ